MSELSRAVGRSFVGMDVRGDAVPEQELTAIPLRCESPSDSAPGSATCLLEPTELT